MCCGAVDIGLSPEGEEILPGIKMCNKKIIDSISGQLGALQLQCVLLLYLTGKYVIYQFYLPSLHNLRGCGSCNTLHI